MQSIVLSIEASWSSPWVCAVYVTLLEKGLPFTVARGMLGFGVGAKDALHDRSLTGTAPVIQHGGFWLAESLAIVEYLEELAPDPRVLPEDVRDRARARQLMAWMRHHHDALRRERPAERIFYPFRGDPPPLSAEARACADDLIRVAERLGADGRGWVLGGRFGVVDVEIAFALMRLIVSNYPVPQALRDYAAAVWARSSVREFVEHPRPPNSPL